jgi:excisionase family DNA binding protein
MLISIPQAAKRIGCARETLYQMVRDDAFPTVKIGRRHKIDENELVRWLASGGARRRS